MIGSRCPARVTGGDVWLGVLGFVPKEGGDPRAVGDRCDPVQTGRGVNDKVACWQFDFMFAVGVSDDQLTPSYSSGSLRNKVQETSLRRLTGVWPWATGSDSTAPST